MKIPFQGEYNPFTEYRQEGNKIFDGRYGTLLGTVNAQGRGFIPSGYEGQSAQQVVNMGGGGGKDYQSRVMAFRTAQRSKARDENLNRQAEARKEAERQAIQRANNPAFQSTLPAGSMTQIGNSLPAGSMTQRGNSLFGPNNKLLGTMQNTSFKDTNPSPADRFFNLQNFQKAKPDVNFSQGDTAFGKTAGINPMFMKNKPGSQLVGVGGKYII